MKITIVGIGYVGLSNAILLAQKHDVCAYDLNIKKISHLKENKSPINDQDIKKYLETKKLRILFTSNKTEAYNKPDLVIISTPTDYNDKMQYFDTSSVDSVINDVIQYAPRANIVIKSTVPVGHTKQLNQKYNTNKILFSPEFLREGSSLHDNLHPSRIIVGGNIERAKKISELFKEASLKKTVSVLLMGSTEAEAVKLFSNTYLAMRVAYFNELDTYAYVSQLNTKQIIEGVSLDPRIGNHYNNPSFGYGGYCLPKDTKQLVANYKKIPNKLISATVKANITRIKFIADDIVAKKPNIVGVYGLAMKKGSDNFRQSSVQQVISNIKDAGLKLMIYEPMIKDESFMGIPVIKEINEFKEKADLILANRMHSDLLDVENKVYTRDFFLRD